MSANIGKYLFI